MITVSLVKEAGFRTAVSVLSARNNHDYGVNFKGVSARLGNSGNELQVYLNNGQSTTDAAQSMADIALATCIASLLAITSNVGAMIVADVYNVTADPSDEKFVKMVVGIDDTTGVMEMFALEKTVGEYGSLPAGKTEVSSLKEFSVPAAGSSLTETFNFIK